MKKDNGVVSTKLFTSIIVNHLNINPFDSIILDHTSGENNTGNFPKN